MTPEKVIEELEKEIHLVEYIDGLYAENISLELLKSVRGLIDRQQAEIVRLKSMNQAKLDAIHDLQAENEALNKKLIDALYWE